MAVGKYLEAGVGRAGCSRVGFHGSLEVLGCDAGNLPEHHFLEGHHGVMHTAKEEDRGPDTATAATAATAMTATTATTGTTEATVAAAAVEATAATATAGATNTRTRPISGDLSCSVHAHIGALGFEFYKLGFRAFTSGDVTQ